MSTFLNGCYETANSYSIWTITGNVLMKSLPGLYSYISSLHFAGNCKTSSKTRKSKSRKKTRKGKTWKQPAARNS